jgi:manganese transport protein
LSVRNTQLIVQPPVGDVWRGLAIPTIPEGSLVVVIGMIGTTIVPYNLFLHASAVLQRWPESVPIDEALRQSRRDTVVSIALGGLVTAAIVVTGAAVQAGSGVSTAADMAVQLAPLLGGSAARWLFAAGMFAAGLTSAITAPLAAAYATAGLFGLPPNLTDWRLRGVWLGVLAAGLGMALIWGRSPTEAILLAQVANGLLLPVVALFLLMAVNQRRRMRSHANGWLSNALGLVVVGLATALGIWHVLTRLGVVE